jgi:hypothetical protein
VAVSTASDITSQAVLDRFAQRTIEQGLLWFTHPTTTSGLAIQEICAECIGQRVDCSPVFAAILPLAREIHQVKARKSVAFFFAK